VQERTVQPSNAHEVISESTVRLPIRLFLVDDHALFREGLVRLLGGDPEFELVGAAADPEAARKALERDCIDVLLLDYDLGEHSSAEFVSSLRRRDFSGKILLVTAGLPDREALEMIRAGVTGIFHKHQASEDLKRSIREVFDGKVLIDEHYLRKLVQVATGEEARAPRLTERERQILQALIEGRANKEIAAELRISESAVKASLQMLFNKTGVRTRSQLVRVALEQFRQEI
jgi:two-component system, NarL family, nitrate/nitrite response regulator NarL